MGRPYSMTVIEDIPLGGGTSENLLGVRRGRTLSGPSLVEIFLNAEDVDVTFGVTVGATEALPAGSRVTLNAVVGVMPSTRDDKVVSTFGNKGDEIVIQVVNNDAVAAAEARAIVWVTELDDVTLKRFVREMTAQAS